MPLLRKERVVRRESRRGGGGGCGGVGRTGIETMEDVELDPLDSRRRREMGERRRAALLRRQRPTVPASEQVLGARSGQSGRIRRGGQPDQEPVGARRQVRAQARTQPGGGRFRRGGRRRTVSFD